MWSFLKKAITPRASPSLDRDIATSGQQEQAIAKIVREEGLEVLAWRVVPTNPDGLGLQALGQPCQAFKTLVVADPEGKLGWHRARSQDLPHPQARGT